MVPDIISLGKAVTSAFSARPDPDTLKEPPDSLETSGAAYDVIFYDRCCPQTNLEGP